MTYAFLPMSDVSQLIVSQILKRNCLVPNYVLNVSWTFVNFFHLFWSHFSFCYQNLQTTFCMTLGLIINCNTFMSTVHCSYSCNGFRASWSLKLWKICWRCCNGQFLYDDITFTFFFSILSWDVKCPRKVIDAHINVKH